LTTDWSRKTIPEPRLQAARISVRVRALDSVVARG
jgi:hypothetical protein